MTARRIIVTVAAVAWLIVWAPAAPGDEVRNVARGEPIPAFSLPTMRGERAEQEALEGAALVLVYLSAEQRSSELAAVEAAEVVAMFDPERVGLLYVTADVVHKPYYERFFEQRGLGAPLAFDSQRALYGELGLIVFPTTLVVNRDGTLAHVISTRTPDYAHVLESYVRHVLGELDDAALAETLKTRESGAGSPKSLASRHRAAARLLREKGLLESAEKELIEARELDPTNSDILLDLADLSLAMGTDERALELARSILETQPEHRRAMQVAGVALYKLGELVRAEEMLEGSIVLHPEPARAHYYLGRIYEDRGDVAEAMEHYREALRHALGEREG